LKAWLGDESVEPISPLCGICGVDDPLSQGMELEADEEEKGDVIVEGKDAVRVGKEEEDRHDEVRTLGSLRKRKWSYMICFPCHIEIGALCALWRRARS